MGPRAFVTCAVLVLACKGGKEPPARDAGGSAAPGLDPATLAIVATLADQVGQVDARRKGEPTWENAKIGTTFRERDWVRTGEPGYARLRFSDKRFVDMPEKTTIIVDNAITIEQGTLVAVASGGESLRVKASDGTIAQIVSAAGDAPSELRLTPSSTSKGLEIAVTKGTVKVVTGGHEQAVAAGEASDLANDRASSIIKLLSSPTGLTAPEGLVHTTGLVVPLSWGRVPGAARYRVQVASDDSFHTVLLDRQLTDAVVEFAPAKPGAYVWRVAAIDESGRVGNFGEATPITVQAEPPPDLLIAPAAGAKIGFAEKSPSVTFMWKAVKDAQSYRLVIMRGTNMTDEPVATATTQTPRIEVRTLREGTFYWGVYAKGPDGESPIFRAPRALTIRKQRVKVHTEKLWQSR